MTCPGPACRAEVPPGTRGEPRRFCSDRCRAAFHTLARTIGTRALERRRTRRERDAQRVAQILTWAEALKPADPAAWGSEPERSCRSQAGGYLRVSTSTRSIEPPRLNSQ